MAELFDTDDKKQTAITAFADLQNHPGWKFFVQIMEANIQLLTGRLETEVFETLDDMKAVQRTRQAYVDALNTPAMIIEAFSRDNTENPPNIDPFQSIEEFRIELRQKRKTT